MTLCEAIPQAESAYRHGHEPQGTRAYVLVVVVGHLIFLLQGCYGDVLSAWATDGSICNGRDDRETQLCGKCQAFSKRFNTWEEKQRCQDECASGNFAGCKGFLQSQEMASLLQMNTGVTRHDKIVPETLKKQKKQKLEQSDNGSSMTKSSVHSQQINLAKIDPRLRAMEASVMNTSEPSQGTKPTEFVLHRGREVEDARTVSIQKASSAAVNMDGGLAKTKRSDVDALNGLRAQLHISQAGGALLDVGRRVSRRSLANVLTATVTKVK